MDYTVITPVEKVAAAAISKGSSGIPWGWLILGALAIALLAAGAMHENDKRQLFDSNSPN